MLPSERLAIAEIFETWSLSYSLHYVHNCLERVSERHKDLFFSKPVDEICKLASRNPPYFGIS